MLNRKHAIIFPLLFGALVALSAAQSAAGAPSTVLGTWVEPTGSMIRIAHCGPAQVCLWIAHLGRQAPATTDIHNPNPALRSRPLCGLEIGVGFTLQDPAHAIDGMLYDPKTGKTYHGQFTARGAMLDLRGYIGVPLFGRTETWTRTTAPSDPCSPR